MRFATWLGSILGGLALLLVGLTQDNLGSWVGLVLGLGSIGIVVGVIGMIRDLVVSALALIAASKSGVVWGPPTIINPTDPVIGYRHWFHVPCSVKAGGRTLETCRVRIRLEQQGNLLRQDDSYFNFGATSDFGDTILRPGVSFHVPLYLSIREPTGHPLSGATLAPGLYWTGQIFTLHSRLADDYRIAHAGDYELVLVITSEDGEWSYRHALSVSAAQAAA